MMQLTKEIEAMFDESKQHGRLKRKDSLAKLLGCSTDEARALQDQWRKKHGERVRGEVLKVEEEEEDATDKSHTILDWFIDGGALILAVVIDIVLNLVVFVTIAPDTLTKVGMAGLALLCVLFSVRGWVKGGWAGKSLWALFAIITTFSDLSFSLYTTDVQTKTAGDSELVRLTDEATKAGAYLESLQSLQLEKGQGYAQQVKDAREALGRANEAVSSHVSRAGDVGLTASGVFSAIPDSVTSGRWIELTFFLVLFIGVQLTVVSAAGVITNKKTGP